MKEKELYLRAELEIIELSDADIIRTSGGDDDLGNAEGGENWV